MTVKVREAAEKHKVDLWFMPPYTPELNAIKTLWSVIKRDFIKKTPFQKYETIQ